jgi:hypothetical protein
MSLIPQCEVHVRTLKQQVQLTRSIEVCVTGTTCDTSERSCVLRGSSSATPPENEFELSLHSID